MLTSFLLLLFIAASLCYTTPNKTFDPNNFNKTIYVLWLSGWDTAPVFQRVITKSWSINNPGWIVQHITWNNLHKFVDITSIKYIVDKEASISPQAKSDIIRMALLQRNGGVWADATVLCMQPLDGWVFDALKPSGFWMYHGSGAEMTPDVGPASWFIISEKNGYVVSKWKEKIDDYWTVHNESDNYYWLDFLFRDLFENDEEFKKTWLRVPYLQCEDEGQAHTLAHSEHRMEHNTPTLKKLLAGKPPYALKLWSYYYYSFETCNRLIENNLPPNGCNDTNAFYAIELSRSGHSYKHPWGFPKVGSM